jgi:hypothetical protein
MHTLHSWLLHMLLMLKHLGWIRLIHWWTSIVHSHHCRWRESIWSIMEIIKTTLKVTTNQNDENTGNNFQLFLYINIT